jgi:hypothetical protein
MAFILSSCGGGTTTSSSSGKGNNELKIETKQALFNQEENLLSIDFSVKNNYNQKINVSLKNLSVDVKPCNVRQVSMTPKNIYFSENITEQYVTALVELIGECSPNSYKISSSKILTLDNKSNAVSYKSEDMEINPDIAVPKDTNLTDTYKFFNIPAPLSIELPDTEYSFKVQLIDDNFRGVSGQEVRVLTYDIRYGEIQNFVVTTDENGFANFLFKSAKDLSLLTGKKLSLTIIQGEEPSSISSTINLKFKDANAIPKNYQLQNPTSIVIENASESKEISVDIVNSLGIGESGKTVQITTIPGKFGAINTSRTVTNDAGRAIFKYTAPDSLDEINNKSVTVTMSFKDGDKELSETAKITIRKSLELDEDVQAEEVEVLEVYSFQNATSITVVKRNQSKDITIDLVDSMGVGVAGKTVKISNIPNSLGTFSSATATTNEAGRATFHYKAPDNIDDIDEESKTVILSYTNGNKRHIRQTITINIKKSQDKISGTINIKKSQDKISGSPSVISISYVGTSQDEARAKYIEKFAISVTDEYGNRVNTRPYISLGAIIGYAVDGKEKLGIETENTRRLFYGKNDKANGKLIKGDTPSDTTFSVKNSSNVFRWVNKEGDNTDKLVVFGAGKNYEAMGKWDIEAGDAFNILSIQDNYFGKTRDKLYYAVGHNYYQDQCQDDGREWLGNTDSETYQLDEEGTVVVSYKYDYHLTGKDALIWVNLTGYQPYIPKDKNDTGEGKDTRIGEVVKHTLRGKGLVSTPSEGYFIDKNLTKILTFQVKHDNAPEWYQNAHFSYDELANKCQSVEVIDSTNQYDARSCKNNGVAYITFKVSSTEEASCNFNIDNILVSNEF